MGSTEAKQSAGVDRVASAPGTEVEVTVGEHATSGHAISRDEKEAHEHEKGTKSKNSRMRKLKEKLFQH